MNRSPRWFEYSMALHVHSRYSDGSGTVASILRDAQKAGVDILGLTDHDTRQGAVDPGEGWYGRTLLLVGAEVTPPQNHLLTFFAKDLPHPDQPWHEIVQQIDQQGGLSFVAHPNDRGNRTLRLPSYRWTERLERGFTGLEIWNHLSHWTDGVKGVPSGLWRLLNPLRGIDRPRPEDLALWDTLASESPTVGIGGIDAHAVPIGWRRVSIKVFPYLLSLCTIRTQVFLTEPLGGQLDRNRDLIKEALGDGRCAIMAHHVGGEKGFRLWVESSDHSWPMGAELKWQDALRLKATSPVMVTWSIIRNGNVLLAKEGYFLDLPIEKPGIYRVELLRGRRQRGWLYANPIYVRD
ncbi:MAG: CehA/McbA family metallohydrolase [Sulfobacillus sp.]